MVNIFAQIVGANTVSLFISQVLDVAGVTDTPTQLTINVSAVTVSTTGTCELNIHSSWV